MRLLHMGLAMMALGVMWLPGVALADGTAFAAQAVAEKAVSPSVRGKLIWARAVDGKGVVPTQWTFCFYDTYAEQNGRSVVVVNGTVSKIEEGFVELDRARLFAYKENEIMPAGKLKLDSDKALAAVVATANLDKVPLSTVHYELSMSASNDVPVWLITLYILSDDSEKEFCQAKVSAMTGQIFSLNVDRDKF